MGKTDSPVCPRCGRDEDTPHNVILFCFAHADLWRTCWDGGPPANLQQALCNSAFVKGTAQFLLGTGRLPYMLPPPPIDSGSGIDVN